MRTVSRMMLGMLAMITWAEAGTSKTFHVSPNGCDTASGSWWRPFATFERAQQAVADLPAQQRVGGVGRGGQPLARRLHQTAQVRQQRQGVGLGLRLGGSLGDQGPARRGPLRL